MKNLPGDSQVFRSEDVGDPKFKDKLLQNCMASISLELKVGAQVMLIKNIDEQLVNGSLGKVYGFMDERTYTYWEETGDDPWSSSHSESATVDADIVSGSESPRRKRLRISEKQETSAQPSRKYPVVNFKFANNTDRRVLMVPETWKVELPTGEVQASRKQVPLILAYAISIHKAQGQTIEKVKVDLGKVFERGQA